MFPMFPRAQISFVAKVSIEKIIREILTASFCFAAYNMVELNLVWGWFAKFTSNILIRFKFAWYNS